MCKRVVYSWKVEKGGLKKTEARRPFRLLDHFAPQHFSYTSLTICFFPFPPRAFSRGLLCFSGTLCLSLNKMPITTEALPPVRMPDQHELRADRERVFPQRAWQKTGLRPNPRAGSGGMQADQIPLCSTEKIQPNGQPGLAKVARSGQELEIPRLPQNRHKHSQTIGPVEGVEPAVPEDHEIISPPPAYTSITSNYGNRDLRKGTAARTPINSCDP